jgi:hypothetical protein
MQRLYEIGDWVRTNYCGGENVARINGYKWYIPRWSDSFSYRNDPHIIYLGSRLCGLNSGYPDFRGDWMWSGKYKEPSRLDDWERKRIKQTFDICNALNMKIPDFMKMDYYAQRELFIKCKETNQAKVFDESFVGGCTNNFYTYFPKTNTIEVKEYKRMPHQTLPIWQGDIIEKVDWDSKTRSISNIYGDVYQASNNLRFMDKEKIERELFDVPMAVQAKYDAIIEHFIKRFEIRKAEVLDRKLRA